MRTRQARASHAPEWYIGSGNAGGTRQGATTWPTGGRIVDVEINVAAGGFQSADGSFDYRDRWLTTMGQGIDIGTYPALQPGGVNDNRNYPWDATAAGAVVVAQPIFAPFYTALGWDAASGRGAVAGQSYDEWINASTRLLIGFKVYADPFTGGLTIKNESATSFRGFMRVMAGEQTGARVAVP